MKMLSGPELPPSGKVTSAVVFLHGLGSNGDDLMGLAPMLAPALPETAFFSPNAPLAMPQTAYGYQWFEYWDRTMPQILDGVQQAAPLIAEYIQAIGKRLEISNDKIILCGFSQGTMMALHAGLRLVDNLGGIIGFSGALISPETLWAEKVDPLPPVLLIHGLQDNVVPASASQQAEMLLKTMACDVTCIQRPNLAHSIDDNGLRAAADFCQRIFDRR